MLKRVLNFSKNGNMNYEMHNDGISIKATSGIDEIGDYKNVILYPNPVKDQLVIETKSSQVQMIHIFNTTGQIMQQFSTMGKDGIILLDMKNLSKGFYLIKIQTNRGVVVKKVLKN